MTRGTIFTYRSLLILVLTLTLYGWFWVVFTIYDNLDSAGFESSNFTIETEGCKIPAMMPFDPSIREFVISPNPEKCDDHSATLLEHNESHIWTRKEIAKQYENFTCCYKAFTRTQYGRAERLVDERVQYHTCINFTDKITVNDEFVRVTCYASSMEVHDHFFLFARKKHFAVQNDTKEPKHSKSSYNVLVMGLDSISRLNLYRTMPKTVDYLKNNGAIELMGYNKVADNTFPNLIPMLMGISVDELTTTCTSHNISKLDDCPFVWDLFKQAGYYTALGEDSSWHDRFIGTPTDYYLHTFFNEAEKNMRKRNKILCSNDEYFFQVLLDYAEDLIATLKTSRLFGFFWEVGMSHDYLNDAAVMDDSYVEFFKKLQVRNYLEETILFVLSDHGMRFGGITFTKQGRFESRLPFLFILAPPSFRDKYSEAFSNLKINSKRLTTPFNLYATLNDLANLDNINNAQILSRSKEEYWHHRSISLFLSVPGNRTCQLAGISDHWCTCHKDVPISMESVLVKEATEYLIKYLNQLLATYQQCAELTIETFLEAREIIVENSEQNVEWRQVLLVVRTRPGQAVFEATVRHYDDGEWALAGQVSRLNLYGNQSHCIDDYVLKLYCYCV